MGTVTRSDATTFVTTAIEGDLSLASFVDAGDYYYVGRIVDALYDVAGGWDFADIDHDTLWAVVADNDRGMWRDKANAILEQLRMEFAGQWRGDYVRFTRGDDQLDIGFAEGDNHEGPGYGYGEVLNGDDASSGGGDDIDLIDHKIRTWISQR